MSRNGPVAQTTREAAVRPHERVVHRTETAPCLLYLQKDSRRDRIFPGLQPLGNAADVSTDTWRESGSFSSLSHVLSAVLHEVHGYSEAVHREIRSAP